MYLRGFYVFGVWYELIWQFYKGHYEEDYK
jgi:hypothetical protein